MTAVEWLEKKFQSLGFDFEHILKQAKEMEKEQIIDAFEHFSFNLDDGEQYYNKTFKSE